MLMPSPNRKEYPNTAISHAAAPQPPHALLKVLYKPGPVMAGMSVKMEVVRCRAAQIDCSLPLSTDIIGVALRN
jgi:hypothetical protein